VIFLTCKNPTEQNGYYNPLRPGYESLRNYGYPKWSVNNQILFEYSPKDSTGEAIWDSIGLWSMNSNGSNKKLFLSGLKEVVTYNHKWSRDGKWITFFGNGQIYKISSTKDRLRQLTTGDNKLFPSWSPDSKNIVFTMDEGPFEQRGFYIIDSSGENMRLLKNISTSHPSAQYTDWSSNGREIAFAAWREDLGFHDLAILDTLTMTYKIVYYSNLGVRNPEFSPDGLRIAFYTYPPEKGESQIWVINKDGTNIRQLTTEGAVEPTWSPDGSKIMYTKFNFHKAFYHQYEPGNGKIWVMNSDGSGKTQITY
jgi:TolB protein